MTFETLLKGHVGAEIVCPIKNQVVRTLTRIGEFSVQVKCADGTVTCVALATPIRYEPWALDRGNMLFDCPLCDNAKLCTEMDTIRYADGTKALITPDFLKGN